MEKEIAKVRDDFTGITRERSEILKFSGNEIIFKRD